MLSEGSQGLVFNVQDLQDGNEKLIAKFFKIDDHSCEIEKILDIQKYAKVKSPYRIPKVHATG